MKPLSFTRRSSTRITDLRVWILAFSLCNDVEFKFPPQGTTLSSNFPSGPLVMPDAVDQGAAEEARREHHQRHDDEQHAEPAARSLPTGSATCLAQQEREHREHVG